MVNVRRIGARIKAIALWALAGVLTVGALPSASRGADANDVVRILINPGIYDQLPLYWAIDKGYFSDARIDLRVTKVNTSAGQFVPFLARGDVDVAPMVMVPAFFNQFDQGFGAKIVATLDESHKGWSDTVVFMVRQDLWDSKAIRKPSDLRGKKLVKPIGAPNDFLTLEILAKAGLTMSNVEMHSSLNGQTTYLPSLINHQYDALSAPEPIATQLEKQGAAHKWLSLQDVIPYYQASYIALSQQFAKDHRDVAQRFVTAYMRACKDVAASNGKWTPELIDEVANWSGQSRDVVSAIPGPTYPGLSKIARESISRQEAMWYQLGMMKKMVPIDQFIDESFADNARKELRIKAP
jgi:ABC-type nitrate/sulfonate/bicarbonate transport system substrate-binding protein